MTLPSFLSAQTIVIEKPEFRSRINADATLETVADGFQFLEGPAWQTSDNTLTFSDIPADRLYRFDLTAKDAKPQIFREPSHHANGNTRDAASNLLTCEHGTRRVTRTRPDGTLEILADTFEGKALSSPNDIVCKRDGTIWFTDPTYGLEGRPKEQTANHVFCLNPPTHELRAVISDFDQPNGLCFSPDETRLYIADSGKPHHVRVFDVTPGNTLENGRVFCVIEPGVPDGMRCDRDGNLWSSAGDGVHVYNPAGERIGKILVPQTPANLCFGGVSGDDLYITAHKSLYRVKLATTETLPEGQGKKVVEVEPLDPDWESHWQSLTPEMLQRPENARLLQAIRKSVKDGGVGHVPLIQLGDEDIIRDCLREFRSNDMESATLYFSRAANPKVIPMLAEDLNKDENTKRFRSPHASDVILNPVSVRAAFVIRETLRTSSMFKLEIQRWAEQLSTYPSDDLRSSIRAWWELNSDAMKRGDYSTVIPPSNEEVATGKALDQKKEYERSHPAGKVLPTQ